MDPEQANKLVLRPFVHIAILLASLAATASSASAQSYMPGVHIGDWLVYGDVYSDVPTILASQLPPEIRSLLGTTSIRTEVTGVTGTNVTVLQQWSNQTSVRNVTLQGDVKTGLGNLTYWIIAGGLSQSDPLREASGSPVINSTVVRSYAGASRYVNLLSTTQPVTGYPTITVQALAYWDQASGALLEFSIHGYGTLSYFQVSANAHVKVTETNLWQAQPDFTLTTSPSSITLEAGASSFSNITLTSVGEYSNTLSVASTVSSLGVQVRPSTKELSLGPGASQSFILSINTTVSTPARSYTVTVHAFDNASLSHEAFVAVVVITAPPGPDFELTIVTPDLTVEVGSTGSAALRVSPLNGFAGSITLSPTSAPSGPVLTVQPVVVYLPAAYGYASATLQVTIPSSTNPGSYVLTIDATGNGRFHTASLLLNATAPAPSQAASQTPLAFFGITLPTLAAIVVAAILLVAAVAYLALKRAQPKSKPESSPVP